MAITHDSLLAYIAGLFADGTMSDADYNQVILYILANGDLQNSPRDLMQIRRGNVANLPNLAQGEMGFTLDEENMYVGGLNGNIKIPSIHNINAMFVNVCNPPAGLTPAKADGTNQTTAINAVIEYVAEHVEEKSGIVYIPAGTFVIDAIQYRDKVYVMGAGIGRTILKHADNSALTSSHGVVEPLGYGTNEFPLLPFISEGGIMNLTIDGNGANNAGKMFQCITVHKANNFIVQNIEALGATECGFDVHSDNYSYQNGAYIVKPVILTNCFAHDCAEGFQLGNGNYSNCWSYRNTGTGFNVVSNYNVGPNTAAVLTACASYENGGNGFSCERQVDYTGDDYFPISLIGCISNKNGVGISVNLKYVSVIACNVANNKGDGIRIQREYAVVENCVVRNNGTDATYDTTFGSRAGIQLLGGTANNIQIKGNRIIDDQTTHTQQYGIILNYKATNTDILIECNTLKNNVVKDIDTTLQNDPEITVKNNAGVNPQKAKNIGDISGNQTINMKDGNYFYMKLTGNVTFTDVTGAQSIGERLTLKILQDATGGRTIAFPAWMRLKSGTVTLTATANAIDVYEFAWDGTWFQEITRSLDNR